MSFELGCNYWPRETAMYMWRELDLGAIREELAHVRDLGFDVVRWFVLAEDFLVAHDRVDARCVDGAVAVARAAADAGLRSVPTLIVINMSGRMWWPAWMGAGAGVFDDPRLLRAQALLCRTVASALAGDASIRAFDLSNEIDGAQLPPSRLAAWLWTALMANAVRAAAPGVPIQVGAHMPSLVDPAGMRLDDVAEIADEDCIHAYPLYCAEARSPLDPELVPFACALTAALSGRGRRPLAHELGVCTAPRGEPGRTIDDDFLGRTVAQYLASEGEAADYYASVLERLVAIGAGGAYAWCYADYAPALHARPPFDTAIRERTFGLVRGDGSEKPACEVFRRFSRDRPALAANVATIEVDRDEYCAAPGERFTALYTEWCRSHG